MTALDPTAFVGQSVPPLVAQEIAAQVTAGVGNADRLMGAGMSALSAVATAAAINAAVSDPTQLTDSAGF